MIRNAMERILDGAQTVRSTLLVNAMKYSIMCGAKKPFFTSESPEIKSAVFYFDGMFINLPYDVDDLLDKANAFHRKDLHPYSLFIHEFNHYLQCMSTVLGQRIHLNWIAVLTEIGDQLKGLDPVRVPLWANRNLLRIKRTVEAYEGISAVISESLTTVRFVSG